MGARAPGDIFGEVPLTLGTGFPVGFRAAHQSRVLRIEPQDYHAIAAVAPDVAKEVGRLAGHRIGGPGGLQGIAADPPPRRAIVVGYRWDPETTELRRFLDRNQITFRWIWPDAPDADEQWWGGPVRADEDSDDPRRRREDGHATDASARGRVAEADHRARVRGVRRRDRRRGPAGLAAAVYGASEGLHTIAIEREAPGGQAGTSSQIENYLGFPAGVSGDELASRALQQAQRLGAEILVTRSITRIDPATKQVYLDGGDVLRGRTIIVACGVAWRKLAIEGFDRLAGKGISYGAARSEAPSSHGLDVHIVGAGNSAGQAALHFANHAKSVTIICRGESLEKSMSSYLVDQVDARSNIRAASRSEVVAAHGELSLEAIDIRNAETGETSRRESGGLYIFIGADAETGWLPEEIALDPRGYVLTGSDLVSPTAGSSSAIRTSSRRASRASSRAATSASAR